MIFFKKYKNFNMNMFVNWERKVFLNVEFKSGRKNSITFKNVSP